MVTIMSSLLFNSWQHIQFRKDYDVDTVLQWKPPEVHIIARHKRIRGNSDTIVYTYGLRGLKFVRWGRAPQYSSRERLAGNPFFSPRIALNTLAFSPLGHHTPVIYK